MFEILLLFVVTVAYAILSRIPAVYKHTLRVQPTPKDKLRSTASNDDTNIVRAKTLQFDHAAVKGLQTLIDTYGAGSWPPHAEHGPQWPRALRPYHEIYKGLCSSLTHTTDLDDDEANDRRCACFRNRMATLLRSRIDHAVEDVLRVSRQEEEDEMSPASWNGFLACIAYSRYAFR